MGQFANLFTFVDLNLEITSFFSENITTIKIFLLMRYLIGKHLLDLMLFKIETEVHSEPQTIPFVVQESPVLPCLKQILALVMGDLALDW